LRNACYQRDPKKTDDYQLFKTRRRQIMKKVVVALMAALMVLPIAVAPMAYADQPTSVSGTRAAVGPVRNRVVQEVGANTIVTSEITQVWTGDISGTAEVQRRQINHPNGEFTTHTFATCTCTVDGVTGILYVNTQGNSDPNERLFSGTWIIVGGEGDLEGLHGQGSIYQIFPAPSVYEGAMHFEP
jgi:hypothetical protein